MIMLNLVNKIINSCIGNVGKSRKFSFGFRKINKQGPKGNIYLIIISLDNSCQF